MSILSDKQRSFTFAVAQLIGFAYQKGYELTLGDAYRDKRVFGAFGVKKAYAHRNSVHKLRLAIDLNLFIDGEYIIDGNHSAFLVLGEFWENLNEHTAWGGRFRDANHFSYEHNGAK